MRSKIREIFWLIMAVLCTAIGIHQTIKQGIKLSYIFFILAIFAILFFYVRKSMRKNNNANQSN
jgi:uncharacterized membrane protein YgaE (UPF0421/DUF939 family)